MLTDEPLTTPVLFLIYNRPEITLRVFNEIKKAKPSSLFVSADGPRQEKPRDAELCRLTREIINQVDWNCKVHTNFHHENVGLKNAVSSGINWFFESVVSGIILEDDCLPSQSFFWFCQQLLRRYHDDNRIMQISGSNFLFGKKVTEASYCFAKLNDIQGWATWKRAWDFYDIQMKSYPKFKEQGQINNYLDDREMQEWLMSYFEQDYKLSCGHKGLWSSQWSYAMSAQNGLTIVPSKNLVLPIGFTSEATHGGESFQLYTTVDLQEMNEIVHPIFILPNKQMDRLRFEVIKKTDPRLVYATRNKMKAFSRRFLPAVLYDYVKRFL